LREQMAARRRAVDRGTAELAGRALAERVMALPERATARQVGLYAALPDEMPTRPCFEALRGAGHALLLPRVGAGRRLSFHALTVWEELSAGRLGILEPPEGGAPVVLGQHDLVLVPGVAFDPAGHRLGRGGGHYDATFPPGAPAPRLFGVAFAFQLVSAVPHDSHDRPMDAIVSERAVHRVAGSGA
jgi:5-formyltetrahydrofolate cyclo-ligase